MTTYPTAFPSQNCRMNAAPPVIRIQSASLRYGNTLALANLSLDIPAGQRVASLEGGARFIGESFPATHFLTIWRGKFSKALGFAELQSSLFPLALTIPVIVGLSVLLLKKQEQ